MRESIYTNTVVIGNLAIIAALAETAALWKQYYIDSK